MMKLLDDMTLDELRDVIADRDEEIRQLKLMVHAMKVERRRTREAFRYAALALQRLNENVVGD